MFEMPANFILAPDAATAVFVAAADSAAAVELLAELGLELELGLPDELLVTVVDDGPQDELVGVFVAKPYDPWQSATEHTMMLILMAQPRVSSLHLPTCEASASNTVYTFFKKTAPSNQAPVTASRP